MSRLELSQNHNHSFSPEYLIIPRPLSGKPLSGKGGVLAKLIKHVVETAMDAELEQTARNIILTHEEFPGQTLAELYDPDKMPEALHEAHRRNDLAVERCYRPEPFESDEERLAWLFRLYEEMIAAEREKDSLFAATKKKSGKGRGRRKK